MKKVEVYFLINLGAILSIFAIEGELGEYMRRQDDILLEVAKDKLESMVSVDNINSLNSDSLYKFTFNLDGEYEENSANVEATFTLNDTSVSNAQYTVSSKAIEKEGSYVAEIPLSNFDVYQDKRFDVELLIGFKPEISNLTLNNWANVFGSEQIATKIEKNISDKVRREGSFKITRKLDALLPRFRLKVKELISLFYLIKKDIQFSRDYNGKCLLRLVVCILIKILKYLFQRALI